MSDPIQQLIDMHHVFGSSVIDAGAVSEALMGAAGVASATQHAYQSGLQNAAQNALQNVMQYGQQAAYGGQMGSLAGCSAQQSPPFGQLSHGQPLGGFGPLGANLGDYADPAKNRKMQHDRALDAMNQLAREKYEPVFQLMGISLTAPWILAMSIVSHPSEWKMEIDLDGKTYRHVWDMLKDDPAEWDAEVGYLLDKVARLRQSLSPPQDAGEPEPVLGAVPRPACGSVASGGGRSGPGEAHADADV
jgi:hypothetical protein